MTNNDNKELDIKELDIKELDIKELDIKELEKSEETISKTNANEDITSDKSLDLDYTFEDLDISWLYEPEHHDDCKTYYTEDLIYVKINFIYVNRSHEITNMREDKYIFKKTNILTKEDLIGLIKRNNIINKKSYSLLSILKYNINIDPHNLKYFFKTKKDNIGNTYLQSIKHIDDIIFDKTITMFHDLNNIMIIFMEKEKEKDKEYNVSSTKSHIGLNLTKRIYINQLVNTNRKKTRRNLFKDNTL
jgi:hypothetical protein